MKDYFFKILDRLFNWIYKVVLWGTYTYLTAPIAVGSILGDLPEDILKEVGGKSKRRELSENYSYTC